jgi:hypothetical protein
MKKLRKHRKEKHPKAHKGSVRKAGRTKGKLDPLKKRTKLIANPQVIRFKDIKGQGLIRVLTRKTDYFPEFALYPNRMFDTDVLTDAGFTDEGRGKWVLRTNKFNIFVYV